MGLGGKTTMKNDIKGLKAAQMLVFGSKNVKMAHLLRHDDDTMTSPVKSMSICNVKWLSLCPCASLPLGYRVKLLTNMSSKRSK